MPNIFRTGTPTKFKLGTQTEHEDPYQPQAPWPPRSKVKVARSRDAFWQVLADKSRMKRPRNTKIGGNVTHPTGNNAYKYQGRRSKIKVTWSITLHNNQSMWAERERKMKRSGPETRMSGSAAGAGLEKLRWSGSGRLREGERSGEQAESTAHNPLKPHWLIL